MSDKPTKLNWRRRKFFRLYMKPGPTQGNATACAHKTFNCKDDNSAAAIGSMLLRKFKPTLREMMEAKGIDDESLMQGLLDGIDAKEVKASTADGEFIYSKELVNLTERRKNRELAHKLRGDLSSDLILDFANPVQINIGGEYAPVVPVDTESTGPA